MAIVEHPKYIKKSTTPGMDTNVPANDEDDATGIAVQSLSQDFALAGKEHDGLEQVIVVEIDGGTLLDEFKEHISEQDNAIIELACIVAGVVNVDLMPAIGISKTAALISLDDAPPSISSVARIFARKVAAGAVDTKDVPTQWRGEVENLIEISQPEIEVT